MTFLCAEALPDAAARQAIPVVLDTNVVLDWLVFQNPHCQPLVQALEAGQLRWLVTEAMRDELAHVLGRGVLSNWAPDDTTLWSTWQRLSVSIPVPSALGTGHRLRCTDPDDQKFVDLALSSAQWLISRDRAVLKLARRAAAHGLQIATPERWKSMHA
ncbi:MAG TPA: PIN domain-containing protein [Rhizobacter sp.]|nr:PIN domain-containing protein [Rhizobacter sp.]